MCLSFITSALLIVVQLRGNPPNLATASQLESLSSPAVPPIAPNASPAVSSSPSPSSSPSTSPVAKPLELNSAIVVTTDSTPQLHNGIALAIQSSLNPESEATFNGLVVDLSDRQVHLYKNWTLQANYDIAVGRDGWETPAGKFEIINMQINPIWKHPFTGELIPAGSGNPLGSRWIGIWSDGQHQIGLHGTNQEDLIGQAVSHGCIRMRESDIQALYDQVTVSMPVIIQP